MGEEKTKKGRWNEIEDLTKYKKASQNKNKIYCTIKNL